MPRHPLARAPAAASCSACGHRARAARRGTARGRLAGKGAPGPDRGLPARARPRLGERRRPVDRSRPRLHRIGPACTHQNGFGDAHDVATAPVRPEPSERGAFFFRTEATGNPCAHEAASGLGESQCRCDPAAIAGDRALRSRILLEQRGEQRARLDIPERSGIFLRALGRYAAAAACCAAFWVAKREASDHITPSKPHAYFGADLERVLHHYPMREPVAAAAVRSH